MKKILAILNLLILLVTILCGCSSTKVTYADLKLEYDKETKTCTIENYDKRDLYGIKAHIHVHENTDKDDDDEYECVEKKIATLFVGESHTFTIHEDNVKSVELRSVIANTDHEWEVKSNKAWNTVGYVILGVIGLIILILLFVAFFNWIVG